MKAPLRPSDPRFLGGYRLIARLGQGGMGTVYLGEDSRGRPVAIKAVKPEFAYEEEFRARFRSEVNRARQVPPFCTAELLDADADHETPYLVVEYVDGPTLAEVVAEQGPLSGGNLYSVAVGVATALAAIHGAGVIHRDLKPANVLFSLGTPKVIDFGIARAFEATSQHTGTDRMVGTVAYMAPERFDSDSARLGPAADVFAWGVVITYAGTGRTPFGGDSAAATAGAILTRPPRLDGLPAPLRDLVARTLAKEPDERPTAFELLDELVASGAPTTADLGRRPELRQAAQAARQTKQPAGQRTTRQQTARPAAQQTGQQAAAAENKSGMPTWRWRRVVPVLAVVAVVALGVLTLPPARRLLFGEPSPEPAAGSALIADPSPVPSARPAPNSGPAPTSSDSPAPSRSGSGTPDAAPPSRDTQAEDPGTGPVVAPTLSRTPQARQCRDNDIELSISAQSDTPTAAGPQKGLVSIANRSSSSCRIDGRVFIGLYNAADERVQVPTTPVDEPDQAVDILLRPDTGAFQGIKWQTCDRDDADCPTGNTLRGSLDSSSRGVVAELAGFPDPSRSLLTMASLKIGTVQPSTQGVVAW